MNAAKASEIAVIIVNYNTAELSMSAIESVLTRSHGGRSVEVFVIDNASPNGDASTLKQRIEERGWTDCVVLRCEMENHGFGRANNMIFAQLGAREVPPTYVFLLNPDAKIDNEAISVLADFLDRHPDAGAAGARVTKPDGTPVSAAFRFPGLLSTLEEAISIGPVSRLLARWRVALPANLQTQRVDWVVGAAVLLRLDAVASVGLFDPEYFLYYEEVDLMKAMALQGIQVWHVADALVTHSEGAATSVRGDDVQRRARPAYWYRSWRHYFSKNHGRLGTVTAAAVWIVGSLFNNAISRLRRSPPAAPLRFYRDIWSLVLVPILGIRSVDD